jgi:hypothetical protein
MYFEKTLTWIEDNNIWMHYDTSFGNRVINWEIAYYISNISNPPHQIIVEKKEWPETNNFISLPNTIFVNDLKLKTQTFETNFNKFDNIKRLLNGDENIINHKHIYFNIDYTNYNMIPEFADILSILYKNKIRPLSHIRIKNHLIDDFLRKTTKDLIGIHIRRGNGVYYELNDLVDLPENVKSKYITYRKSNEFGGESYTYTKDSVYYKIIDNFLEMNPNQKFYLSTDLPYNLIYYFVEKYKDNIMTKENLITKISDYLPHTNDKIGSDMDSLIIDDMVDIFSLSYCKFLVKSEYSTWSDFAKLYRNQPCAIITENWEKIKDLYLTSKWEQWGDFLFNNVEEQKKLF